MSRRPVMTIGHSSMEASEFAARCQHDGIREVIDIRSHPTSKWPQFRKEPTAEGVPTMPEWLARHDLKYEWEPGLGGWNTHHYLNQDLRLIMTKQGVDLKAYADGSFPKHRIGKQREHDDSEGPVWYNQGLYDYAWFTTMPEFQEAAHRLVTRVESGELRRPAIMCAEALWWKCHRSMVADYLVTVLHCPVFHVQPRLTSHSNSMGNRVERYPELVRETWGQYPRT